MLLVRFGCVELLGVVSYGCWCLWVNCVEDCVVWWLGCSGVCGLRIVCGFGLVASLGVCIAYAAGIGCVGFGTTLVLLVLSLWSLVIWFGISFLWIWNWLGCFGFGFLVLRTFMPLMKFVFWRLSGILGCLVVAGGMLVLVLVV